MIRIGRGSHTGSGLLLGCAGLGRSLFLGPGFLPGRRLLSAVLPDRRLLSGLLHLLLRLALVVRRGRGCLAPFYFHRLRRLLRSRGIGHRGALNLRRRRPYHRLCGGGGSLRFPDLLRFPDRRRRYRLRRHRLGCNPCALRVNGARPVLRRSPRCRALPPIGGNTAGRCSDTCAFKGLPRRSCSRRG